MPYLFCFLWPNHPFISKLWNSPLIRFSHISYSISFIFWETPTIIQEIPFASLLDFMLPASHVFLPSWLATSVQQSSLSSSFYRKDSWKSFTIPASQVIHSILHWKKNFFFLSIENPKVFFYFLLAYGRAVETSTFGFPILCMWPVYIIWELLRSSLFPWYL